MILSIGFGLVLGGVVFTALVLAGGLFRTSLVVASIVAVAAVIALVSWAFFVRSQASKKALWLGVWSSTLTGSTPADAEPDAWLPRLRSRRTFWKVMLIAAPIEFGAFFALGLVLVISDPSIWWHWAELFVFGAIGILGYLQARLQLGRIDRAMASLLGRS